MRWIVIIVVCSITLISRAATGDVKVDADTGSIWISGEITDQDAKEVEASFNRLEIYTSSMTITGLNPQINVTLSNSLGGNVFAAMKIGSVIRKLEARTLVEGDCFSSCPMIFIAGVVRNVYSETIGLHRPYLADGPANRKVLETAIPGMLKEIKHYVADMGISDGFYEQMVNTDSSQMRIFRNYEIYSIVPENDAVYQEILFAYAARGRGTTSAEVRRRKHDSEACKEPEFQRGRDAYMKGRADYWRCVQAILWGLSERVFEERDLKSKACKFTKADFADLRAAAEHTSHREMRDHPILLKTETCVRDIMLDRRQQ